jgi:hypothetical protein
MSTFLRTRYRALHHRFGTAGVVLGVIALIAALGGTAFAAGGGLSGKQKKEVKAIAKSFQGTGPAGAAGTNGTNGTNGKNGTTGKDGTTGINGKSVALSSTAATCPEGGISVEVEGTPASKKEVCNGEAGNPGNPGAPGTPGAPGSPWTAGGTLPPSTAPGCPCTETGTWTLSATAAGTPSAPPFIPAVQAVPISFPIPTNGVLASGHAIFVPEGNTTTAHCSEAPVNGTLNSPKAESGYLCVYDSTSFGTATPDSLLGPLTGITPAGAVLVMDITEDTVHLGTWAVTG